MSILKPVGDWKSGKGEINKNDKDIRKIQSLLTSLSILKKEKKFDPKGIDGKIVKPPKESSTVAAIIAFQETFMDKPDGVVSPGKKTYKKLIAALKEAQFPPKPGFMILDSNTARAEKFGKFGWKTVKDKATGVVKAGSDVKLTDDWAKKNIEYVTIPYLKTIPPYFTNRMRFNKSCKQQLLGLWHAWHKAGLLDRIVDYGGAYTPRLQRRSTTKLSSHAWGTAFDINVPTNRQGIIPPYPGEPGSVRELVAIANEYGFYWGGHFSLPDGMHFEVAIIGASPSAEIKSPVIFPSGGIWV